VTIESGEESGEEDDRKALSSSNVVGGLTTTGICGVGDETGDGECFEKSRCNEGFFNRFAREAMEADRASAEIEEEKEMDGVDLRCMIGFRTTLSRGPGNWN